MTLWYKLCDKIKNVQVMCFCFGKMILIHAHLFDSFIGKLQYISCVYIQVTTLKKFKVS